MKKTAGFTLIELMIVVAVIAIISAVALPSYNNAVMKGRRSDAQQLMLDTVNRQEQYLLDARAYTTDFTDLGISKEDWTCTTTNCTNNFYSVAITVGTTPPTFTVTATPTGAQSSDGTLTITNLGTKTPGDKW